MSAGADFNLAEYQTHVGHTTAITPPPIIDSLDYLAPKMKSRLELGLARCADRGLDTMVYETLRSAELQAYYYARGRDIIPPTAPVTNARTPYQSWHGYGLAVDIISAKDRWFNPDGVAALRPPKGTVGMTAELRKARAAYVAEGVRWFTEVSVVMKSLGLDWGGDWRRKDYPHFQFGTLKASPSPRALELLKKGGLEAVWKEVGAV